MSVYVRRAVGALGTLVVASAALLASGCADEPRLTRLSPGAVVVAFGDSLTHGTGASPEESYPAVLAGLSGLEVVNAGVPGEVTSKGLARLPGVLEKHAPKLVVLCHGGNDILRRSGRPAAANNLREMVKLARASGAEVVMLAVPDFGIPGLLSAADFYAEVAEELDVPIHEDLLPDIVGDAGLKSDRVHPNGAGYRKMAEGVRDFLVELGALPG